MTWLRFLAGVLAWMMLLVGMGDAWASPIYVTSAEPQRLPVYSDRPLSLHSRLFIDLPPAGEVMVARRESESLQEEQQPAEPLVPVALVGVEPAKRRIRTAPVSLPSMSALARRAALLPLIDRAGRRFNVNQALLHAVIDVESAFQTHARSPKGAMGLMQVMPTTAARYGRFDLTVAAQNLEVGARHLRGLLDMFEGDVELALAAYNAGEGAVAKYGNRIPPFAQTRSYVQAVIARHRYYSAILRAGLEP